MWVFCPCLCGFKPTMHFNGSGLSVGHVARTPLSKQWPEDPRRQGLRRSLPLPTLRSPPFVLVAAQTLLWVASFTFPGPQFLWSLVTDVGSLVMSLGTLWLSPYLPSLGPLCS